MSSSCSGGGSRLAALDHWTASPDALLSALEDHGLRRGWLVTDLTTGRVGASHELLAPLARAVLGGLTVSTLITLVLIPVVYSLFHREPREAGAFGEHSEFVSR